MSAPDPDFGLMEKAIAVALGCVGTIWGFLKLWDKKADKHAVNNMFQEVKAEQAVHRTYFAKVSDQMRENEQRAQDRHERLMERLQITKGD